MYFRTEMKLYIRIVGDLSIQEPFTLCQVNQVTIFISYHIACFKPVKSSSLLLSSEVIQQAL